MGKTLRLTRQGFEVIPDMAGKVTGKEAAWNSFYVMPGVVFLAASGSHAVAGLGKTTLAVNQYVRLTVILTNGAYTSATLDVTSTMGKYYDYSAGADTETYQIAIAKRTRSGISQYLVGTVMLDRDIHVAVAAKNTPGYLDALFNDTGTKGEDDALVRRDALQGDVPDQKIRLYMAKTDRPDDWDEKVAVDEDNTPGYLGALFNDTGTKSGTDALVYRDDLQGAAPDQKIRLYVPKAGVPDDWDEKVAVDEDNTPNYLAALFNDTGSKSGTDVLVYRDALQGTAPNQKVRLFVKQTDVRLQFSEGTYIDINDGEISVDLTEVSGYSADAYQMLVNDKGTFKWVTITDDFECPTTATGSPDPPHGTPPEGS